MSRAALYAPVPDALVRDKRVGAAAVRTYSLLMRYANRERIAWPRQSRLAQELDCSRRTVERAIAELRAAGWVSTRRRAAGGVCEYTMYREPVSIPCEPPDTDDGTVPTPMAGHREREPENERLASPTPPQPAVRSARQIAEEKARREAALDPACSLGLWDKPAKAAGARPSLITYDEASTWESQRPRSRRMDGDSPMGLALAWRETMREAGIAGSLDANLKALAAHFKAMMEQRVTPSQIRAMTRLFAAKPGLRNPAASPWRDFLYQRQLLLEQIRGADRFEAAAADPTAAYTFVFDEAAERAQAAEYHRQLAALRGAP